MRLFSDGAANPELADAVTAVRVVRDRATNVGKGVAYVEVRDHILCSFCALACRRHNGLLNSLLERYSRAIDFAHMTQSCCV